MLNKKHFLMKKILILFFIFSPLHAHSVFILIHGTWALEETWHMPGGDFFDVLEKNCAHIPAKVIPFCWTGRNRHEARVCAAQGLVKLIQSYPSDVSINIIAHSHGSNVGILASHILAMDKNNNHHIDEFYALGTPINSDYQPDMSIINYVYNLFSFEDLIQPVVGMFKRVYEAHDRIANIRITIDGNQPDHSNLHSPIIGSWLPHLHAWLLKQNIDLKNPGIIHFVSNQEPQYEIDEKRSMLIERDLRLSTLILLSFRTPLQSYPKYH